MKEEKQKVGQIKKKKIREAAKKCFLTKGFQSTTMEDVITEIGMSRGVFIIIMQVQMKCLKT